MNKRKLYRDNLKGFMGGVASGMASYFDIDVSIIRLLWVLAFVLFQSFTAIAYVIMWMVVPEAKTPAERLQMKGLDPTEENINNETEQLKYQTNRNSGCMSTFCKVLIILAAISVIFPLLLLFWAIVVMFGAFGIGMAGSGMGFEDVKNTFESVVDDAKYGPKIDVENDYTEWADTATREWTDSTYIGE